MSSDGRTCTRSLGIYIVRFDGAGCNQITGFGFSHPTLTMDDGIYPQEYLTLEKTGSGTDLDYVDLFIKQTHKLGIQTGIHDRRLSPQFKRLNIIRNPHVTSALMDKSKFGIVTSQLTRCRELCSSPQTFTFQSALIMFRMIKEKGFNQRMVRQKVHRFMLNSTNGKYPRHTSTRLTTMTNAWYGLLALGKIVPGADGWTAVL